MTTLIKQRSFSVMQQRLVMAVAFMVSVVGAYISLQAIQQSSASAATSCVSKVYKQGSKDTCVKYMQQMLNASGKAGKIDADGVFGSGTKSAVVKFQKAKKLSADGVVGSGTWKSLCGVSGATSAKKSAGCGEVKKQWVTVPYSYHKQSSDEIRNVSTITFTKGHTYKVCVNVGNVDEEGSVYVVGFSELLSLDRGGEYCTLSQKFTATHKYSKGKFSVYRTSGSLTLQSVYVKEYK